MHYLHVLLKHIYTLTILSASLAIAYITSTFCLQFMDTPKVLGFTICTMVALLIGCDTDAQFLPGMPPPATISPLRPLCASQFALVNHACIRLPLSTMEPDLPDEPLLDPPPRPHVDALDPQASHGHEHAQSPTHQEPHHHRHHTREPTPIERDCCRWLKEVDTECVCDLLIRLPPFLARPVHEYIVIVHEVCTITYSCGGGIRTQTRH